MKRILLSASIFGAIIAAGAGQASAEAAPRTDAAVQVAEASSGSGDLIGSVLNALTTGSAQECDGVVLDACVQLPGQTAAAEQAFA
ncbi:hypothetical protein ACFO5K_09980 [Nocardia halotolerans]|uniref:UrcA family protein n=1 Tax=Nocardia halotolerans TaxID=1755878 RepID=A0ABV8VI12_9NOCA